MSSARQQGVVLVVVLWMVAILSIVVVGLSRNAQQFAHEVGAYTERAEAKRRAESEMFRVIHRMVSTGEVARNRSVTGTEVRIEEESHTTDINLASERQIEAEIHAAFPALDAPMLAARIVDWRDADDNVRESGAEHQDYVAGGQSLMPRNGPFLALDELHQVLGISTSTAEALQHRFSIHSRRRRASDANEASSGVTDGRIRKGRVYEVTVKSGVSRSVAKLEAKITLTGFRETPFRILQWRWL